MTLFRSDRFTARMMADAGTILMRGFLVGFHLSFDADDPATWATPGNLRRALVGRGLASARGVDDMLARFRVTGYVEPAPAPGDRRRSLLVPSARLIGHDREHLAAYHRFLLVLYPGRGYEWVEGEDGAAQAAHRAIRREGIRNTRQSLSVLQHAAMMLFLARDAGYLALLLVLQAQLGGEPLSWTAMAATLGASRSHLRRLFGAAEAAGYVRLPGGRGSAVEVEPELWRAYDGFLAGVEADQDAIAQAAFQIAEGDGKSR